MKKITTIIIVCACLNLSYLFANDLLLPTPTPIVNNSEFSKTSGVIITSLLGMMSVMFLLLLNKSNKNDI